MAFTRIKDSDLAGKGVKDQSTVPGLSAEEMKASVEQIVREVAIPGVNRLAEELEADSAAGSLGSEIPAGDGTTELPEDTPKNVGGVAAAIMKLLAGFIARRDNPHRVTADQAGAYTKEQTDQKVSAAVSSHANLKNNPHAVTADQVGAYTKEETDKAIDQKVQDIGAADMTKAVYDPQSKGIDVTVQTYTHTRSGTIHNLVGSGANGRALMTANVQTGDTWTVNGRPVTAYMGADAATDMMAGSVYSGKWVSFVVDGSTLNFKGGGGQVTVSGLAANKILEGTTVTVKQGAKTVASVAGSIPDKSNTKVRIPYLGQDPNVGGYVVYSTDVQVVPGIGYYGNFNNEQEHLELYGPELAGAIGLTPDILLSGKTVLGIAGTLKPVFVFKSSGNQETSRTYQFVQNYAFVVIVGFYVDTGVTGFTVNTSGQLISTDAVGSTGQYVPKAESKVYANIKAGDTITMAASGPPAWGARLLIYGFG